MNDTLLDTLIRDITKVGSISKSEVRKRLQGIIASELKSIREEMVANKKDTHPMEDDVPVETYGYAEEFNSAIDASIAILDKRIGGV